MTWSIRLTQRALLTLALIFAVLALTVARASAVSTADIVMGGDVPSGQSTFNPLDAHYTFTLTPGVDYFQYVHMPTGVTFNAMTHASLRLSLNGGEGVAGYKVNFGVYSDLGYDSGVGSHPGTKLVTGSFTAGQGSSGAQTVVAALNSSWTPVANTSYWISFLHPYTGGYSGSEAFANRKGQGTGPSLGSGYAVRSSGAGWDTFTTQPGNFTEANANSHLTDISNDFPAAWAFAKNNTIIPTIFGTYTENGVSNW